MRYQAAAETTKRFGKASAEDHEHSGFVAKLRSRLAEVQ